MGFVTHLSSQVSGTKAWVLTYFSVSSSHRCVLPHNSGSAFLGRLCYPTSAKAEGETGKTLPAPGANAAKAKLLPRASNADSSILCPHHLWGINHHSNQGHCTGGLPPPTKPPTCHFLQIRGSRFSPWSSLEVTLGMNTFYSSS